MKYIILYNPKSNRGKTNKNINKLKNKLIKKGNQVEVESLLSITNTKEYIKTLNNEDKIIIFGGDGTLHYLANKLIDINFEQEIFVARKAGTGNDFVRSLRQKTFLIKINDYIKNLPYQFDNNKKRYFINSVGIGLDALVCDFVEKKGSKTEGNYFKSALKGIKNAQTYNLTIEIDGKEKTFKKVWFTVVCNSQYFGGGMKISPKSVRLDDKLEIVVVNRVRRWLLLLIFPTIYLGIHGMFKKWVHFYEGKHIKIKTDQEHFVEFDGEKSSPTNSLEIFR